MQIAAVLSVALCLFAVPSTAAVDFDAAWQDEIEYFRDALPDALETDAAQQLLSGMEDGGTLDTVDSGAWLTHAARAFREAWPSAASMFLRMFGVLLCCAILNGSRTALASPSVCGAWELCGLLCLSLAAGDDLSSLLMKCGQYIESVTQLLDGVTPLVCTITAASGKLSSAAAGRAMLLLLYTLLQNVYAVVLLPAVQLSFCFGIAGSLGGVVRLDAITRWIRRVLTGAITAIAVLFAFMSGVQSAVAGSADSLAMRTAKFAMSSAIPLVGGALSDALGTAAGSMALIRTACGVLCAASVWILALPVLLQLLLHRAALALCQGAAEMMGCDRESRLLGEMHAVLGYMLAVAAVVSLVFLFALALVIFMQSGGE